MNEWCWRSWMVVRHWAFLSLPFLRFSVAKILFLLPLQQKERFWFKTDLIKLQPSRIPFERRAGTQSLAVIINFGANFLGTPNQTPLLALVYASLKTGLCPRILRSVSEFIHIETKMHIVSLSAFSVNKNLFHEITQLRPIWSIMQLTQRLGKHPVIFILTTRHFEKALGRW